MSSRDSEMEGGQEQSARSPSQQPEREPHSRSLYDWLAPCLLAGWFLVYYWQAALGLGMFYFGDIARFFYPTRVLYADALRQGRLPLWTPEILAGFPLFAEMQTGALYPPHLLLYRLLPVDLALNYDILLHLGWLAVGVYLFARIRNTTRVGAAIAALAFAAGGFGAGRITHLSVIAVAAWLPWMLLIFEKWRQAPRLRYWVVLTIVFALQFLAGHPQFILLNLLTFGVYVVAAAFGLLDDGAAEPRGFAADERKALLRLRGRILERGLRIAAPFLGIALAAGIAAVQLVPTAELAQASARAGGVTEAFFTEFSYHPLFLALLVDPFVLGNPYPRVSVEVVAYLGALPLVLAGVALVARRKRDTGFWALLALGAFVLALGGYNPLYRGLRFLPLLNFFRVPARFLFPMSFALALLAGQGFDALWTRARAGAASWGPLVAAIASAVTVVSVILLSPAIDVDGWVAAWRILAPLFIALALLLVLRTSTGRLARNTFAALALGLTLVDLAAFGAVYAGTFNAVAPRSQVFAQPRVLDTLILSDGARTRTSEWILPWISVMRESLYPNLNAAFGVQSAQGYTPLIPRRTQTYFDHLSPVMLDLLGVRYFLIPQVLPVDAESEGADLADPFMINPIEQPLEFMPTEATGIEVESALAQSVDLRDGDVVAEIKLRTADGRTLTAPLRAGIDTAEWAYDRSDVRKAIKHSRPPIATTFPAESAFPPESHDGHFFKADITFSQIPEAIVSISVEPKIAAGLLHIQRMALTDGVSHVDVATMVGKSNHRLIYRSQDVAVFENPDYAPRAFLTHSAAVVSDEEALARLQTPGYDAELLLAGGEPLRTDMGQGFNEEVRFTTYDPEHVVLEVKADSPAYLVLADAWDPGWVAYVDGVPTTIQRADLIFRAVPVLGGQHTVEFFYRPLSFYGGLVVSIISLALLGIVAATVWLARRLEPGPVI